MEQILTTIENHDTICFVIAVLAYLFISEIIELIKKK